MANDKSAASLLNSREQPITKAVTNNLANSLAQFYQQQQIFTYNNLASLTQLPSAPLAWEPPLVSTGVAVLQQVVQFLILFAGLDKVLRLHNKR